MSLTEILSSLEEKSQKSFLERMINKADSLNDKDFEMLLSFSSSKYPDLAVQYLLKKKRNEEAVKLLEDNNQYLEAAKLCAELQLFEKAAWNYYREGLLFCTGDYCKDVKKHREFCEVLHKEYEKLVPRTIAEIWLSINAFFPAAFIYRDIGMLKEAAVNFEHGESFYYAGAMYEHIKDFEAAFRCYKHAFEKTGHENSINAVVDMLKLLGRTEELLAFWEQTNNNHALALHYEKYSPQKAAEYYFKAKYYRRAAESLIKAEKYQEAIALLFTNECYQDIVELKESFSIVNDKLRPVLKISYQELAKKYELSNPEKSANYYSLIGEDEKANELFKKLLKSAANTGNFAQAAEYALRLGDKKLEELYHAAALVLA